MLTTSPEMDLETYLSHPAVNMSRLRDMQRSPAYCRHRMMHPDKPTPAMLLGTAVHMAILEPERFGKTYYVLPEDDNRTAANRAALKAASELGRPTIKPADRAFCAAMSTAVDVHPAAWKLLYAQGHVEYTAFKEMNTLMCKCRVDKLTDSHIIELKTTADPRPEAFSRQMYAMGYHMSAAWYTDIVGPGRTYTIIAVANTPPHEVYVYNVAEVAIDLGRAEYTELLNQYSKCLHADTWPGGDKDVQELNVPMWVYSRMAAEPLQLTMGGVPLEV